MPYPPGRPSERKSGFLTSLGPHLLVLWVIIIGWLLLTSKSNGGFLSHAIATFKPNILPANGTPPLEPYYNFSSVPPEVLHHVKKWVETGDCVESRESILVTCCYRHFMKESQGCGGIADRMKGLGTVLLAAERAGRKLCIHPDYLVSSPLGACEGGVYKRMTEREALSEGDDANPLEGVTFVSSNKIMDRPSLGLGGKVDAGRLGAAMVAVSGTLHTRMGRAVRALEAARDVIAVGAPFVAVHVRCGASSFLDARGNVVNCLDYFDKKNTSEPDGILKGARELPRGLKCKKMLYVASDSRRYRTELEMALPPGMKTFSCCTSPEHIDKVAEKTENLQHLVDLAAFGSSSFIFRTSGGYALLGSTLRGWDEKENEGFGGKPNESSPKLFWKSITERMGCEEDG